MAQDISRGMPIAREQMSNANVYGNRGHEPRKVLIMWRVTNRTRKARALLAWIAMLAVVGVSMAYGTPDTDFEIVSPLGNKDCGKSETAVGDLVADAVRAILRTDVAFVASSELKPRDEAVPAGKASSGVLADLVSYADDPLAVLELSGRSIRAALERSVSIYPQPNMAFLQVSGLRFTFSANNSRGQRVMSVTINGKSVSDDARYKVGLTNSLANGAVGYWKVWSQNDPRTRVRDKTLIKALEADLKANPRVDYSKLDRITASSK